ncbi:MAG: hypothetical protein KF773_26550 [Deltaproteobacteria bacterium]|nr:hypothetical protein [Deltaproteobacteria bacterium]
MSALQKPEADPPDGGSVDADGWALLDSLRRRLDDQAAQGRKTQQQVAQLADSIGALVAAQRRRVRWINLNSFVAYLIFTILCGTGAYLLYTNRASELVTAREQAERERDAATRRADELAAKVGAREQGEAAAWEVHQLFERGKRADATTKLDHSGSLALSRTERAVLTARAKESHAAEVEAAYKNAIAAFKAGKFAEITAPLESALVGEPAGPRRAAMHYYAGIAYAKTGALEKAINHLTTAVAADVEHQDARYQLADALDRAGAFAKARVEYDRFATAFPLSPLAAISLRRSATLARMPGAAPPPQVQPKAPPPPPAPAPSVVPPKANVAPTPPPPEPAAPSGE